MHSFPKHSSEESPTPSPAQIRFLLQDSQSMRTTMQEQDHTLLPARNLPPMRVLAQPQQQALLPVLGSKIVPSKIWHHPGFLLLKRRRSSAAPTDQHLNKSLYLRRKLQSRARVHRDWLRELSLLFPLSIRR